MSGKTDKLELEAAESGNHVFEGLGRKREAGFTAEQRAAATGVFLFERPWKISVDGQWGPAGDIVCMITETDVDLRGRSLARILLFFIKPPERFANCQT